MNNLNPTVNVAKYHMKRVEGNLSSIDVSAYDEYNIFPSTFRGFSKVYKDDISFKQPTSTTIVGLFKDLGATVNLLGYTFTKNDNNYQVDGFNDDNFV
jgi:hypothetical protein